MNPVLKTFHRILDELDAAKVEYMLMGGWAVQVWGRPRPTFDVDLTLMIADPDLSAFLARLDARGFIVEESFLRGFQDELKGLRKVQVAWLEVPDPVRVELFLVRSNYQEMAFSRRLRLAMFGREVYVISAEDLILHKLLAARHKDLAAIEDILDVQLPDHLDLEYLRSWAARLSLDEALAKHLGREKRR
jgi:hypothetical protein